jgi:hypothetical protein
LSPVFFMPAVLPPPPPTTLANHVANQHRPCEGKPPLSPAVTQHHRPSTSQEPSSSNRPPVLARPHEVSSLSHSPSTRIASPGPPVSGKGKQRRSSTPSTDYSAEFDCFSINTEFLNALHQMEAQYFPQKVTRTTPPPSTSSPSTESSLIPSTLGEPIPLSVGKRWVVFRGRVPGVYLSS